MENRCLPNHLCCEDEKFIIEQQDTSKSLCDSDGISPNSNCNRFIEESYGYPIQNTITSFVSSNNTSTVGLRNHTPPRKVFHKMSVDQYPKSGIQCTKGSKNHPDVQHTQDICFSESRPDIFPDDMIQSGVEGISKMSSNSLNLSPSTGCERLL